MTEQAQSWLPPGAASGGLLRPTLQSAVEGWSAHWCATRSFSVARLTERGAAKASDGWISRSSSTAVRILKPASTRLVEAALDLRPGVEGLTDRDRRLADRLVENLIEDLCARIEAALDIEDRTPVDGQAGDWVEIVINEGVGSDLFSVALPIPALAVACRKAAGAVPRLTPLAPLSPALSDVQVLLEATLGRLELSMPELAGLEPGDVLVLPTRVDQPIEVSLHGSSQTVAHARLADQDGEFALAFQTDP